MRLILVGLYLFLYFTVGMLYLGAEWLFGRWNQKASMLRQYRFVQWGFRCILFISGVKVHAKGTENVPEDEAVLYVANHRGIFDVLVTAIYCKGVTGYISKIVIKKVPCLRVYMKRIGCLFMDREDIKQSLKIILEAIEQVKMASLFLFFRREQEIKIGRMLPILPHSKREALRWHKRAAVGLFRWPSQEQQKSSKTICRGFMGAMCT